MWGLGPVFGTDHILIGAAVIKLSKRSASTVWDVVSLIKVYSGKTGSINRSSTGANQFNHTEVLSRIWLQNQQQVNVEVKNTFPWLIGFSHLSRLEPRRPNCTIKSEIFESTLIIPNPPRTTNLLYLLSTSWGSSIHLIHQLGFEAFDIKVLLVSLTLHLRLRKVSPLFFTNNTNWLLVFPETPRSHLKWTARRPKCRPYDTRHLKYRGQWWI